MHTSTPSTRGQTALFVVALDLRLLRAHRRVVRQAAKVVALRTAVATATTAIDWRDAAVNEGWARDRLARLVAAFERTLRRLDRVRPFIDRMEVER